MTLTRTTLLVHMILGFLTILFSRLTLVSAQNETVSWTTQPFLPPSLPLAVRSPYLNAWLAQGEITSANAFNMMWTRNGISGYSIGWYVSIMVDNIAYRLMGRHSFDFDTVVPVQTSVDFSPTRTTVISPVGPVDVNMSFWSPIEPEDVIRQSFPGIYLGIGVKSRDGLAHNVSVYADVTGEWITGSVSFLSNWTNVITGGLVYHQVQLTTHVPFAEFRDMTRDAQLYFGMEQRAGLTYMIGPAGPSRRAFNETGGLPNSVDMDFRSVGDNFPVFAMSVALGNVIDTDESSMVVFSLAVLRDPVVKFVNPDGTVENRSPAYLSEYVFRQNAYEQFVKDQIRSRSAAATLDARLLADAGAISPEYANLISLVTRQVMGAGEITMGRGSGDAWNKSDVVMFVKDIGGLGAGDGSVNAVDVLYAAFPAYLYLNPDLGSYVLRPLLHVQSSPIFPHPYAAPDLGGPYPNATGNSNAHNMGVDHTASMLIMVLAQAQASGNRELIDVYYPLLKKWGDYLVNNTLSLSTGQHAVVDSAVGSSLPQFNQTNLAIKGIIGIAAMAKISDAAGFKDDATRYEETSKQMMNDWIPISLSADGSRVLANFNSESSGVLLYNLFADKLLKLGLVPDQVYQAQTIYAAGSGLQYGLPLSSFDPQISRTDWMMFTAATLTSSQTRNVLINQLQNFASAQRNNTPYAVAFDPTTGVARSQASGANSAAQGALFSLLALTKEIKPIASESGSTTGTGTSTGTGLKSSSNIGAIVGGVVGGVVVLGALAFFLYRRRRANKQDKQPAAGTYEPYTLGVPKPPVPPSQFRQGGTGMVSPTTYLYSDMTSSRMPGDSIYSQEYIFAGGGGNKTANGLPAGAAAPYVDPHVVSFGSAPSNGRGSAYFRQREDISDIGPSVSQVGALTVVSGSGASYSRYANGSSDTTRPTSNASRSTASSMSSQLSQTALLRPGVAHDGPYTQVNNLRRGKERSREELNALPAVSRTTTPLDEEPPSYYQHEDTHPVTIQ